jgi:hypothetical protein
MSLSSSMLYYTLEAEIKHRVGKQINYALKKFGTNKKEVLGWSHFNNKKGNSPTWHILGCNGEQFIKHIESQFVSGMKWENRDLWYLKRRKPISSAKDVGDVLSLFHYSNYQPAWE